MATAPLTASDHTQVGATAPPARQPGVTTVVTPATPVVDEVDAATEVDEPFDGYAALAAAHIVARLARLNTTELNDVRRFEAAHRARRTVLAKIDQLVGERSGA